MSHRRHFLVLACRAPGLEPDARRSALEALVDRDSAWLRAGRSERLTLWVSAVAPLPVQGLPDGGWVIGDLFDHPDRARAAGATLSVGHRDAARSAKRLLQRHWGAYVAILLDGRDDMAVFRDPSGQLDALTWRLGDGIEIVSSDLKPVPPALRARWPFMNWDRLAAFVAEPAAATTPSLFDDIDAVGPGELLRLGGGGDGATVVWDPVTFARDPLDPAAAAAALRERVDTCTAALLGQHTRVILELSGGLDSAVLAGTIGGLGLTGRVAQWLNLANGRPEADESDYARAVTDRLGVGLTRAPHEPGVLTEGDFADVADAFWPASGALDPRRDRDEVSRLATTNATAIVSGQGGDALFFQMPSSLVAADLFDQLGVGAYRSPFLAAVARRTRQSIWSVLGDVHRARRGRFVEPRLRSSLASRRAWARGGAPSHTWSQLAAQSDLPLGKRFQIKVLVNTHLNHVASRRRRAADLLFPLLSQPIMETCLAIPTPVLAGASYDRPFERETFADRIPKRVRDRRSKGNLSVYFSHLVACNLGMLRPYLLDGCLCEARLLDRREVERVLDPQQLIWDATPTDVLWAAVVEGWVRYWQTRVPDSPQADRWRA